MMCIPFSMRRFLLTTLFVLTMTQIALSADKHSRHKEQAANRQETGFLNRRVELRGNSYRYQVYLPEDYKRDDRKSWPIALFLHGRGERGSEGMWQTQVGLPQEVRDHPERWPMIIVMPQCPLNAYWTDPAMQEMALAALEAEVAEFHTDPNRTYLTGLSMGGYGSWELAKSHPNRWAAVAIIAGGVFWTYTPERWQQEKTLPTEYAKAVGKTSIWLFHGSDDSTVIPKQSDLMYEAIRANGGRIRLWIYQGLHHDSWTRAYNEPELPRWLLQHHLDPEHPQIKKELPPYAERQIIPLHPPALKLTQQQIDALVGDYEDGRHHFITRIFRQGEFLYEKNSTGDIRELAAESQSALFYPNGSSITRLTVERDAQGRIIALVLRDDRHEERWEHRITTSQR